VFLLSDVYTDYAGGFENVVCCCIGGGIIGDTNCLLSPTNFLEPYNLLIPPYLLAITA